MYTKNYPKESLSRNSRRSNLNQPAESGILITQNRPICPISLKIDVLKFVYSAVDDAPAVVPLGIWAFSSLTRAVARVALSDLNHSGSIPLYGRLRVSAEQIL
jgi:hypothetical protein